jgi:uncharacterized protein (DUF362 family)
MQNLFVRGVDRSATESELATTIERVFLDATNNLEWLKTGETVLLKPALNSPDRYPATTHPLSIRAIAKILEDRGAKVIVADQSGIEHVLHAPSGVIRGSSKKNFEVSGMGNPAEQPFIAVEQQGWDEGFTHFKNENTSSWPDGFYITKLVQEADHIINLPRLSTHAQAGVTLGFKSFVGWLREDSRLTFHANGPFNGFIAQAGAPAKIEFTNDHQKLFFEKIVEISEAVKEKLRLTLFTGTAAQVTLGPDGQVAGIKSTVVTPPTGLVFASTDPVAAESFAISFLTHLYHSATPSQKLFQKFLMWINGQAEELGSTSVKDNPFIKHAKKIGLGTAESSIHWENVPNDLQKQILG